MGIQDSIANLSMQMSSTDFSSKLNTKLMSKVLDYSKDSAMGIVNMIDDVSANAPAAFPGDIGSMFDAMA